MPDDIFAVFQSGILNGQAFPPDLRVLLQMQANRPAEGDSPGDPLWERGARIIMPGEDVGLRDSSYINDTDRANPDTMANVRAFADLMALCTIVVELDDTEILGYWHGPEAMPMLESPLIFVDTEGQIAQPLGRTITEMLLGHWVYEDTEGFARYREAFAHAGIEGLPTRAEELVTVPWKTDAGEFQRQRYNAYRAESGLPPV